MSYRSRLPPTDSTKEAAGRCEPWPGGSTCSKWVPGIDGGYEQLRATAIEDEVPGVGRIALADYDDLVAMKRAAGRPQDEADLHELEQVRGEP